MPTSCETESCKPWSVLAAENSRTTQRCWCCAPKQEVVPMNKVWQDLPEDLKGAAVSHDSFAMVGVEPALGRSFTQDDDQPGADRVVLLSNELWQRRFSADPSIIGRNVTLSGDSYTVIGVMPRGLSFPILNNT